MAACSLNSVSLLVLTELVYSLVDSESDELFDGSGGQVIEDSVCITSDSICVLGPGAVKDKFESPSRSHNE